MTSHLALCPHIQQRYWSEGFHAKNGCPNTAPLGQQYNSLTCRTRPRNRNFGAVTVLVGDHRDDGGAGAPPLEAHALEARLDHARRLVLSHHPAAVL